MRFSGETVLALRQVRIHDLEIVERNVSEGRATFHVAKRPYAGHVRFEAVVDLDKAVLVRFDSRIFQAKITRTCSAVQSPPERAIS